jgi:23S rRNA (pseudouridine1915-N3)-methyltransferase
VKIRVLWAGKTKKAYYRSAIDDYSARIKRFIPFEIVETREESTIDQRNRRRVMIESRRITERKQAPVCVLLDSKGKMLSSEEFAQWLEKTTGDIDFIVGGPAGFDTDHASVKMSFGRITLPHELARVVLLEQIFRALTILHRVPYHK